MKVIAIREPGGPEVLKAVEVELPLAGPGESHVAVRATGVNLPDIAQRLGRYAVPVSGASLDAKQQMGFWDGFGTNTWER